MSLPGTLGPQRQPIPVSAGGTGSVSESTARASLDVPSLSGNNSFTGTTNSFGGNLSVYGDVTMDAGTLTLNGTLGNANIQLNKSGSIIFFDPAYAPGLCVLSASPTGTRLLVFPDASGNVIVSADSPAKGTILYHNGSAWKCLAPSAGVLTCDGSGNLSWA